MNKEPMTPPIFPTSQTLDSSIEQIESEGSFSYPDPNLSFRSDEVEPVNDSLDKSDYKKSNILDVDF